MALSDVEIGKLSIYLRETIKEWEIALHLTTRLHSI